MARRKCGRKGNRKQPSLKRQNAHETLPRPGSDDAPSSVSDGNPQSDAITIGDFATGSHSHSSVTLEFESPDPDPDLLDNDDDDGNMTVIGDMDVPCTYSVIWKNRV